MIVRSLQFLVVGLLVLAAQSLSAAPAAGRPSEFVTPIRLPALATPPVADPLGKLWKTALNRSCQVVLGAWWQSIPDPLAHSENTAAAALIDFGYLENNGKKGKFGQETKGGIRSAAESAYTVASALFTGAYEPAVTEVSREIALRRVVWLVKSLAHDHLANGGIGVPWGDQWQSSQWASKVAVAGWLVWDDLDPNSRDDLARMLIHEADRFLEVQPPSANENYVNDTKAEENGWDASGLQTACALLPNHPHHERWFRKACQYRLTALAKPSDRENRRIVDGLEVRTTVTGYNIDEQGALGNHDAYPHPDYMASPLRHVTEGSLFLVLGGQRIPESNTFNCAAVYANLVDHIWNEESTIYRRDGTLYWPVQKENNRRFDYLTFSIVDVGAALLGYDSSASVKGPVWEERHLTQALAANVTDFPAASGYLLRWLASRHLLDRGSTLIEKRTGK